MKRAAMGGLRSFADTRSAGKVAPFGVISLAQWHPLKQKIRLLLLLTGSAAQNEALLAEDQALALLEPEQKNG